MGRRWSKHVVEVIGGTSLASILDGHCIEFSASQGSRRDMTINARSEDGLIESWKMVNPTLHFRSIAPWALGQKDLISALVNASIST